MSSAATPLPTPYGDGALAYLERGWAGVLPVPARSKKIVIEGRTGHDGIDPTALEVQYWHARRPTANIALRLPDDVIGIDIDSYKVEGAETFARWEIEYGPLPPTWRSTARDDGSSGIRYFRVPGGLLWAGQLGPGVDIIQHSFRYAMVPPSVHPEGWVYRWRDPNGYVSLACPSPEELPALPESWAAALARGPQLEIPKVGMDSGEAWE